MCSASSRPSFPRLPPSVIGLATADSSLRAKPQPLARAIVLYLVSSSAFAMLLGALLLLPGCLTTPPTATTPEAARHLVCNGFKFLTYSGSEDTTETQEAIYDHDVAWCTVCPSRPPCPQFLKEIEDAKARAAAKPQAQ